MITLIHSRIHHICRYCLIWCCIHPAVISSSRKRTAHIININNAYIVFLKISAMTGTGSISLIPAPISAIRHTIFQRSRLQLHIWSPVPMSTCKYGPDLQASTIDRPKAYKLIHVILLFSVFSFLKKDCRSSFMIFFTFSFFMICFIFQRILRNG